MSSDLFPNLFSEFKLGKLTLKNRITLAPLTRQLAEDDGTPDDEMVAYMARRARGGVGMIFCEAAYYNDELSGIAYLNQPGIANAKHVAAWKKIVDAVHAQGKSLAEKHGMDVLNNDKVWKKPNGAQKAVGIGSVVVMLAVLRWL